MPRWPCAINVAWLTEFGHHCSDVLMWVAMQNDSQVLVPGLLGSLRHGWARSRG